MEFETIDSSYISITWELGDLFFIDEEMDSVRQIVGVTGHYFVIDIEDGQILFFEEKYNSIEELMENYRHTAVKAIQIEPLKLKAVD